MHSGGIKMIDLPVSKELMIALLSKLARDDEYRARFEQNAGTALVEIGFPSNLAVQFPNAEQKLADKAEFEAARQGLTGEVVSGCLCMIAPGLQFNYPVLLENRFTSAA
jgi:putative modified peptide